MLLKSRYFVIVAIFCLSRVAFAEDNHDHGAHSKSGSGFYGYLDAHIQADSHLDGDWLSKRFSEVYSHSHLELGYRLKSGFSVNANIKLEGEPSGHAHGHGHGADEHAEEEREDEDHEDEDHEDEDHEDEDHEDEDHVAEKAHPAAAHDKVFKDHPLFIGTLTFNYDSEAFSAYIGKFNPVVGFNYHDFPGMYISQTVEHYGIRERVGFGMEVRQDLEDYGQHSLHVSSFFADTALSDSVLRQRGNNSKEDGGASNTEEFESYSISVAGKDFYSLDNNIVEGLSYRVGHATQAAADNNSRDEYRYSVSVGYKHIFSRNLNARLVTEHMAINNLGGEKSHDRSYNIMALRFNYKSWNWGTAYTFIDNTAEEEKENHDGHIVELSAGYKFDNGVSLDVGYKRADEENEESERISSVIKYSYEF